MLETVRTVGNASTSYNLTESLTHCWDWVVGVITKIANFIFSTVPALFGYGHPTTSSSSSASSSSRELNSVNTLLPTNDIISWNTNIFSSDLLPSSFLLDHLDPSLSMGEILRCILPLPTNFTAQAITSDVVTLYDSDIMEDDQQIEKKVRAWLGKKEGEGLSQEDIFSLRKYICYRSLPPKQKDVICIAFFENLSPLLHNQGTIILPFNSYDGKKLSLSLEDGSIVLQKIPCDGDCWKLSINGEGKWICEDQNLMLSEGHQVATGGKIKKEDSGENIVYRANGHRFCKLKTYQEYALALLELLLFKYDEIIACLKGETTQRAKVIFDRCWTLLNQCHLNVNGKEKAAIAHQSKGRCSVQIGPLWSPIAASEDSTFIWTITKLDSGQTTLSFQKNASGRGLMGGNAQRTITLKTTGEFNQVEIEVKKEHANDLEDSSSISTYLLKKEKDGIHVCPKGKETNFFLLGFESQKASSEVQLQEEIKEDADFILKTLTTIADIACSPDTMMVDQNSQLINLEGRPVPLDRLKFFSYLGQGIDGHPAFNYRSHSGLFLVEGPNGSVYLNLPSKK